MAVWQGSMENLVMSCTIVSGSGQAIFSRAIYARAIKRLFKSY